MYGDIKEKTDSFGNLFEVSADNIVGTVFLYFNGHVRFKSGYGKPKNKFTKDKDELILYEIDFPGSFCFSGKCSIKSTQKLPLDLKFGDTEAKVIQKIGKKPSQKWDNTSAPGKVLTFYLQDYRIMIFLDEKNKLNRLKVSCIELHEKQKIEFKKDLMLQKKNIDPDNSKTVQALAELLPTTNWWTRMAEGDDLFTKAAIEETEELFNQYIEDLTQYTLSKKASNIFNSVKKIVRKINKVNTKHNKFIETTEREELCHFINEAVRATGFKNKKNIDLTEEWREW